MSRDSGPASGNSLDRYRPLLRTGTLFAIIGFFFYLNRGLLISYLIKSTGLDISAFFFIFPKNAFICEIKTTAFTTGVLLYPLIIYALWHLFFPSRTRQEQAFTITTSVLAAVFFFAGVAISYWYVIPKTVPRILPNIPPPAFSLDFSRVVDFLLSNILFFGCALSVPVLLYQLIRAGKNRRADAHKEQGE